MKLYMRPATVTDQHADGTVFRPFNTDQITNPRTGSPFPLFTARDDGHTYTLAGE